MSNATAVAAVTLTLQSILGNGVTADTELTDTTVSTLPPDKARGTNNANQLNLFLYQVLPNAAWRNMTMPRQLAPGESGQPPLPLTLHYLLTAFGRDNDMTQPFSHQVLGKAMSVLYDHALLGPEEIKAATAVSLPTSDLDRQVERVRITLQPLSLEEISKLWTGFATQYRLSVAYEVSVALIESTQSSRSPLPVLTRGAGDQGVLSQPDLIPPYPAIDSVVPPNQQTAVRLGETVTITGQHLDGTNVGVVFNHPLWAAPVEVAPQAGGTATELSVIVPNQPAVWPVGLYSVSVVVKRPGGTYRRTTNELGLALAPRITITPGSAPAGNITYTVSCAPQVWPDQRASLLLGDQEILGQPHATQTGTVMFVATAVVAGTYFIRLRVDGVDSVLVDRSVKPPVFDATQKVTVT
jgi:Pvc16 N-terminal domain